MRNLVNLYVFSKIKWGVKSSMKKIIALVGDYYHEQSMCKQALNQATEQFDDLSLEYTDENQFIGRLGENPDAVIIFKGNKLNPKDQHPDTWLNEEDAKKLAKYVEDGGALFAWHSGIASYEVDAYVNLLKGKFTHHPPQKMIRYQTCPSTNFFADEFEYTLYDEHYFIECNEEEVDVFLRSYSEDGESIAGWTYHYGKGRVLCLTPSHNEEALLHDQTQFMIHSAIKKCIF